LQSQAESVARQKDPNATVATIAWLGYEPPSNLAKAGRPGHADDAAPHLASFVNGLDSSRDTDPNLTVIGHSYGSLVASEALQRGTAADNVLFMGSPGLETSAGEYFDDPTPEKFHLTEGHVFVEHAKDDYVADLRRYGNSVISGLPGFIDLSTDAESTPLGPTIASEGHSEYSLPDTTALYDQAVVVAGLGGDPNYVREEA
jgi:pimeloyl-ACP methyl ester carboxylesterase